jgi:hypothetical protein
VFDWSQVLTAVRGALWHFYTERVRPRKRIGAHSGHLPGHALLGLATRDPKPAILELIANVQIGGRITDWRQLVLELAVERLCPLGQANDCLALAVQGISPLSPVSVMRVAVPPASWISRIPWI